MSLPIVVLISVVIAYLFRRYQKYTNGVCTSTKRLYGKTAIVTGGTAGMGLIIATDFAKRGARVIIACPFQEEGIQAKKKIEANTGNENVVFKLLDLASLKSVRSFAADILKSEDRLDILMNNAGVGIPGDFLTKDNLNFIMQVNYLGHALLSLLLLPLLIKSGSKADPSRIVNTSSVLHQIGKFDMNNMNRTGYYPIQIYGNSKLYLVLYSQELKKRLSGAHVVVNNIDPGNVGTRIFDSAGKLKGIFVTVFYTIFFKTPEEGAQTAIHTCVDSEAGKVSGEFFKDCRLSRAAKKAYDEHCSKELWKETLKLVELSDSEVDSCFNSA